jgi:hypothetical protein
MTGSGGQADVEHHSRWGPRPALGALGSRGGLWVLSESGDTAQGVILGAAFQDGIPAPSAAGEAVEVHLGRASLIIEPARILLRVGGVSVSISDAGLAVTGGSVTHNDKNIGDDHVHSGVQPGGGTTGDPV